MSEKENVVKAYDSGLFTQKEIADKVKKSQSYVSNLIAEAKKEQEIEELKKALVEREKEIADKDRELDFTKLQRDKLHTENEFMKVLLKNNSFKKSLEMKDDVEEVIEIEK